MFGFYLRKEYGQSVTQIPSKGSYEIMKQNIQCAAGKFCLFWKKKMALPRK